MATRVVMNKVVVFEDDVREGKVESWDKKKKNNVCWSDESSSSIGKNSDVSENLSEKSGEDEEEVESKFKGPLDAMDALEQVLPIRRGISRFYNGKSKSFASLADASSSSSIKDIVKPNNAYTRKRRNMLPSNHLTPPLRGVSKRLAGSGRSNLALAVAMTGPESANQTGECNSSSLSPRRSFSLADLQRHRARLLSLVQI